MELGRRHKDKTAFSMIVKTSRRFVSSSILELPGHLHRVLGCAHGEPRPQPQQPFIAHRVAARQGAFLLKTEVLHPRTLVILCCLTQTY